MISFYTVLGTIISAKRQKTKSKIFFDILIFDRGHCLEYTKN